MKSHAPAHVAILKTIIRILSSQIRVRLAVIQTATIAAVGQSQLARAARQRSETLVGAGENSGTGAECAKLAVAIKTTGPAADPVRADATG